MISRPCFVVVHRFNCARCQLKSFSRNTTPSFPGDVRERPFTFYSEKGGSSEPFEPPWVRACKHLQSQCQAHYEHSTYSPSRTTVQKFLEKQVDAPVERKVVQNHDGRKCGRSHSHSANPGAGTYLHTQYIYNGIHNNTYVTVLAKRDHLRKNIIVQ